MSSPVDHRVTADDGTVLRASVREGTGPTIVFAHGWALSARSWNAVREAPALRGVRTIAYDQRHHGGSARADSPLSVDLLGADLRRVIETLVPDGRIVLAGHSMGGMTIMALAAAEPALIASRVAGVALVSTSAGNLAPRRDIAPVLRHHRLVDTLMRLAGPVRAAAAGRMLFGPGAAPEVVRATADEIAATETRAVCEFWPVLTAHDKVAALGALAGVPVEILVGDRDRLTPPRHARLLADRIAGARLRVLPRLGHMLTSECPELLSHTLIELSTAVPTTTR